MPKAAKGSQEYRASAEAKRSLHYLDKVNGQWVGHILPDAMTAELAAR